jgi:hypothetical protein
VARALSVNAVLKDAKNLKQTVDCVRDQTLVLGTALLSKTSHNANRCELLKLIFKQKKAYLFTMIQIQLGECDIAISKRKELLLGIS